MKTPLMIVTLLSAGIAGTSAKAADDVEGAELPINEIEIGLGYVSDDSWKFGRYNGLYQKGPFLIGDINTQEINEEVQTSVWNPDTSDWNPAPRARRISSLNSTNYQTTSITLAKPLI